ncbi:MAG: hypothetical protein VW270_01080 [Candidatus Poseidoniales archaeon]
MAVERNPFDRIEEDNIIEIGINPESTEIEAGPVNMEFADDGGVVIEFGDSEEGPDEIPEYAMDDEEGFFKNLVDDLDEDTLEEISNQVLDNYEADKESRAEWESMFERGFDLLGLKVEEASEPFEGACTAVHPLIIESAVKFQSKATQELFPPAGPVRTQIVGKSDERREQQSQRVKTFMNYQLTEQIPEYFDETERMLFNLPLIGSAFKKIYFDTTLNRPVSEFVPIDQFFVSYYATDLRRADRYTHLIYRSPIELQRCINAGMYAEIDLPTAAVPSQTAMAEKMNTILGLSPSSQHDPQYVLLEQHCYLELPTELTEEDDGLALPYIVTIEEQSRKVLSVRRNYNPNDPAKQKKMFFTHYRYVPGFGFYGLGLIHFLGNLTMTATAAMRALVDAGQFANLPGGFKQKGVRIVGDNDPISPGEFKDVEATGVNLQQAIVPLPYKEPSSTLFNMLNFISQTGQKFADTTEQIVSDAASYGPVGTTMALLEASSKFFSAIHKRLHKAQKDEFKLLARLNYEYLPDEEVYDIPEDTITIYRRDFDGRVDVVPVSDPNIPSNAHRMALAQLALNLAQSSPPGMFNMEELNRTILSAANVPNLDKIMPSKPDPIPLDPMSDILAAVKGMPIQAFVGQNHDAHVAMKSAYIQDPMNGANPAMQRIVPVLQANIQEHMILKYQEQIGGMSEQVEQQAAMSGQAIDEKTAEMIMAQAAQQISQTNTLLAQQGMNITPEQQMVQLEGQRLSIEQQKLQAQIAKEQAEGALKNRELQLKEMKLSVDAYTQGASQILKSDEKEKDRNAKKAMKAVEIFADLLQQEENLTNDRILKAADIVSDLAKDDNIE